MCRVPHYYLLSSTLTKGLVIQDLSDECARYKNSKIYVEKAWSLIRMNSCLNFLTQCFMIFCHRSSIIDIMSLGKSAWTFRTNKDTIQVIACMLNIEHYGIQRVTHAYWLLRHETPNFGKFLAARNEVKSVQSWLMWKNTILLITQSFLEMRT